ncbi:Cyclic AMP-dependent transcription factor ATF-4 [Sciurus carolinensis]|uniref:Cyclic AMP-dependent transcription factor ATF-4 n=1 Tax=Sciurus carolinensis TaxID=30640 RepID=A0AA41NK09_SCICA|nr:Cyclic AMP-dependent transcription factor ATF-4 [Sciurus carolinensis]
MGSPGDKAKVGSSQWLPVDGLVDASDTSKEDAFSGTDWMLEKMDLKEFDFDALLSTDDLETMPRVLSSTQDHSFSLELGSEVDISEGDSTAYGTMLPQCVKEEDTPSDKDSGICMSPESYLDSPDVSLPSPGVPCGSNRPKPYDPPGD